MQFLFTHLLLIGLACCVPASAILFGKEKVTYRVDEIIDGKPRTIVLSEAELWWKQKGLWPSRASTWFYGTVTSQNTSVDICGESDIEQFVSSVAINETSGQKQFSTIVQRQKTKVDDGSLTLEDTLTASIGDAVDTYSGSSNKVIFEAFSDHVQSEQAMFFIENITVVPSDPKNVTIFSKIDFSDALMQPVRVESSTAFGSIDISIHQTTESRQITQKVVVEGSEQVYISRKGAFADKLQLTFSLIVDQKIDVGARFPLFLTNDEMVGAEGGLLALLRSSVAYQQSLRQPTPPMRNTL